MNTSCWLSGKDTSRFTNVVCASLAPWDVGGIFLVEDVDVVAVYFDATIDFLDCSLEASLNFLSE